MDIEMEEKYDYKFKFIIIGDASVGKSCLLHHFLYSEFNKASTHTLGIEFGEKIVAC